LDIGLRHQARVREVNIQLAEKEKEITELKTKIEATTKEIDEARTKLAELEKKVTEAEKSSAQKDSTVQRLTSELSAKGNAPVASSTTENAGLVRPIAV